jgi:hypothetical protein
MWGVFNMAAYTPEEILSGFAKINPNGTIDQLLEYTRRITNRQILAAGQEDRLITLLEDYKKSSVGTPIREIKTSYLSHRIRISLTYATRN